MSGMNGKVLGILLLVLIVVAATVALVATTAAREDDRPMRAITVSARGYRFNESNPTLVFHPGERVRITFVNDEAADSRIAHNFKLVGLQAKCSRALNPGESETIEVNVPASGEYRYTCCAHPGMGGKVVLE